MSFIDIIYSILIGPLQLMFEIIYSFGYRLLDHPGLAIIALSLVMNILILPLYKRADAMQEAARDIDAKLKAGVDHIKKTFSGDEQMMILQTYYRQNNYKPTDALNGSVSLLLEVPFFMAAYNFLSHLEILQGVTFGPIADLSAPDGLLTIAGVTINVLPVIMTLVNIISSEIYTKGFPLKTKIQLHAMAIFFLFFLYTSPSGLVFYWTLNNIFSLGKNIVYKVIAYAKKKSTLDTTKVAKNTTTITNAKSDKALFVLGAVVLTILVGLLIPSTYISASTQEFIDINYYYDPTWYIGYALCYAAGTFLVWMQVFYWIASPKGKAAFDKLIWILCGVMLMDYLFFGTNLGILLPNLKYENTMSFTNTELILNMLAILGIGVLMYIIISKFKNATKTVLLTVAIALFGMSIVNMVEIRKTVVATEEQIANTNEGLPRFTLSKDGKNVVVIMLDRALGEYIPFIMEQHPELKKQFSGFTYYSNVISHGQSTKFGVPGLFGGYEYVPSEMNKRDTESVLSKHNEALKVMPIIFDENDYDVTVCDPPYANYEWIPDVSIYDEYPDIDAYITEGAFSDPSYKEQLIKDLKRNFFCFSVMKTLPLPLQNIWYQNGNYNQLLVEKTFYAYSKQVLVEDHIAYGLDADSMDGYNVLSSLSFMTWIADDDSDNFMMMANGFTHNPMMMQLPNYEPSQVVDNTMYTDMIHSIEVDGTTLYMENTNHFIYYQTNVAALMRIGEWLDYLKQNDVYDNTKIILVSDHGCIVDQMDNVYLGEELNNDYLERYFPLLMVKDFNSDGFKISDEFMTTADVPALAFDGTIEKPMNPFTGNAINSDAKGKEQYITASENWNIKSNNGNTFKPSQWYAVKGNIWNKDNWRFIDEYVIDPTGY